MKNLPALPRVLKKREADITPRVIEWFRVNYRQSVALEIKTKGGKLKPHQKLALEEVAKGLFSYKIPDTGRKNCFDAFILKNADAFVVFCEGSSCEAVNIKTNEKISFNCSSRKNTKKR